MPQTDSPQEEAEQRDSGPPPPTTGRAERKLSGEIADRCRRSCVVTTNPTPYPRNPTTPRSSVRPDPTGREGRGGAVVPADINAGAEGRRRPPYVWEPDVVPRWSGAARGAQCCRPHGLRPAASSGNGGRGGVAVTRVGRPQVALERATRGSSRLQRLMTGPGQYFSLYIYRRLTNHVKRGHGYV
jgi:hypothetical protein